MNENSKNEEMEVLKAMGRIAKYRSNFASSQHGFENIASLVDLLLDISSKIHRCPNCESELNFYVKRK